MNWRTGLLQHVAVRPGDPEAALKLTLPADAEAFVPTSVLLQRLHAGHRQIISRWAGLCAACTLT